MQRRMTTLKLIEANRRNASPLHTTWNSPSKLPACAAQLIAPTNSRDKTLDTCCYGLGCFAVASNNGPTAVTVP